MPFSYKKCPLLALFWHFLKNGQKGIFFLKKTKGLIKISTPQFGAQEQALSAGMIIFPFASTIVGVNVRKVLTFLFFWDGGSILNQGTLYFQM